MERFSTLLATMILIFAILLFSNYSANPPNGETGAPGEGTCAICHTGNAGYQGTIELSGIPDTIAPATSYAVTVTLTATTGSPAKGGFQLVALNDANENAGTLTPASDDTGTNTDAGRTYIEHRPAKAFSGNTVTYNFNWESPAVTENEGITMYFVGNFANGDGSSSNDKIITNNFSTFIQVPTGTDELVTSDAISIFPNPSTGLFSITHDCPCDDMNWEIYNVNGEKIQDGNQSRIDLRQYAKGVYFVKISTGKEISTERIIVQ